MKRCGPLKRKTPLKRSGFIRRRNEERLSKQRERDFGELAEYVRGLSCAACGYPAPSDPAHVRSRGAGGHARLPNGDGNLLPLCRICHTEQHSGGWSRILDGGREEAELRARAVGKATAFQVLKTVEINKEP